MQFPIIRKDFIYIIFFFFRNSDVTSSSVGNIAVPVPVIVTISIFLGIILAALIFLFVKKCRRGMHFIVFIYHLRTSFVI